jgi:glycosyltransferase involved in cell wall biosynthesis
MDRSELAGQSILCFPPGSWHDMWRSRHQIMSRLARSNLVLWVEPRLSLRQTRRAFTRQPLSLLPQREHIAGGLHVLHNPALLPSSGPRPLKAVSSALYHRILKSTMGALGMTRPILWLHLPEMIGIIGQYNEQLVVYHVVDEYSAYGGMPESYIPVMRALEEQLLRRADIVIVTSPALLESKSRLSTKVHLVPNAVDYEGFQRTLATAAAPAIVAGLPRPVIGYVGAINDKLDYRLLDNVAVQRPDWALLLVGPIDVKTADDVAGLTQLRQRANVHHIDQVPVADVPCYMAACQVCLLPYKINERTRNISALKLYEYLACGRAVVSTGIPAAGEGQGTVRVAGTQDFVQAIEESLTDDTQAAVRRRQVAANNTWDQRVDKIARILQSALR